MEQHENGEKAEIILEYKAHKQEHERLASKLQELNEQLDTVYKTNKRLRQMSVNSNSTANDSAAPVQTTRFETPQKNF